MRVAFCSSEVFPFAKTGGLADVCGTLPYHLAQAGVQVDIFMPFYEGIKQQGLAIFKCDDVPAHVVQLNKNIRLFLIDHDEYFKRDGLYGDEHGDYSDNFDRFTFFAYQTLHVIETLLDQYDVIHCHDWQTALIIVILKNKPFDYQKIRDAKTIFTIHNLAYQGLFPEKLFHKLRLPDSAYSPEGIEFHQQISFLKGAIVFADEVTTVSPQYAKEVQTKQYGCGLEGVCRRYGVTGILNGLDYEHWNPAQDKFLTPNFTVKTRSNKKKLKNKLRNRFNLPEVDAPLLGFVGRLSHQKGLDLIAQALPDLLTEPIQIVIIGTGEKKYEKLLHEMMLKHPTKIAVHTEFSEELAHLTYGASDFFLMPSVYEPCGLTQMIALAYGTIPIVSKTGGLVDTIEQYKKDGSGNGFIFDQYTVAGLVSAVDKALALYKNETQFDALVKKAFTYKFTWKEAAKKYMELYQS